MRIVQPHIAMGKMSKIVFMGVMAALLLVAGIVASSFSSRLVANAAALPTISTIQYTYDTDGNPSELFVTGTNYDAETTAAALPNPFGTNVGLTVIEYTSTTIRIGIPADLPYGQYNLKLMNNEGLGASYGGVINKVAPTPVITNVTTAVNEDGTLRVTITGDKFAENTAVYICKNDEPNECSVGYNLGARTATSIEVDVYTGLQESTYQVRLLNENSETATYENAFTYAHPPIQVTATNDGYGNYEIIIDGSVPENTLFARVGSMQAFSEDWSVRPVTAWVYGGETGTYDLTFVLDDYSQIIYKSAITFEAPAPVVDTVESYYNQSEGKTVLSLRGSNLTSDLTVKVGGISAPISTFYSSTYAEVLIDISTLEPGVYDLIVENESGDQVTKQDAITVEAILPIINGRYSNFNDDKYQITVFGTELLNATVTFEGGDVEILDQTNSYITFAPLEELSVREYDITVTLPHGSVTTSILYPDTSQPSIGYTSVYGEDPLVLGVYGDNFVPGTILKFNGQVLEINYRAWGAIETDLPSSLAEGIYEVEVIVPNGNSVKADVDYKTQGIKNVAFTVVDGRRLMVVSGYQMPSDGTLPTVNGTPYKICTLGSNMTIEELVEMYGMPAELLSDAAPCMIAFSEGGFLGDSDTIVRFWLADSFDQTAPGNVTIGDLSFDFEGQQPQAPTAGVGDGSLENTPTIPARPTFSGKAAPGSAVVVTVYSDPITCTAVADSNGDWSCTLPADLPAGTHTVFVLVTNLENEQTQLGPYSVVVDGVEPTILAPNTGFMSVEKYPLIVWVVLGAALAVTGGMLARNVMRTRLQKRKTHQS